MIGVNKDYYENKKNYSYKSLEWLLFNEKINNVKINYAYYGKETIIQIYYNEYKVDGYDEENKTVYEFNGCYFHGCQKCYGPMDVNKLGNKNMIDLYNKTILKEQKIKENGYNVISIWECEYDETIKKVKKIKQNDKSDIHTQRYNNEQ